MAEHGEVRYFSASRGETVEIDKMPTSHLANAAKKLARERDQIDGARDSDSWPDDMDGTETLVHMIDELASRVPPAGS